MIPNPPSTGLPNPASYDLSIDGVVVDRVTGLMWQRAVPGSVETGCPNGTSVGYCTQPQAAAYCDGLSLAGYSDWHLPSVMELDSIVDYTVLSGTLDRIAFPSTLDTFFTSSRYIGSDMPGFDGAGPWMIGFDYGVSAHSTYMLYGAVRCVRVGGSPAPRCPASTGRFEIMHSGGMPLVTDTITGLVWQQMKSPNNFQWANATAYCGGLAGNFRLPSVKELQSIMNYDSTTLETAFYTEAFPMPFKGFYWTSSPGAFPDTAWVVSSVDGYTTNEGVFFYDHLTLSFFAVLCVH